MNTANTVLKIVSTHSTLEAAVAAAVAEGKMDLSYNPQAACEKIKNTDRPDGDMKVGEAFYLENGEVWYTYLCDITLLNKFEPFISVLHNSPFFPVMITKDEITIVRSLPIPRDRSCRKIIAKGNLTVTTL